MMNQKNESKMQIGLNAYESPRIERVQVKTEGSFAASESVDGVSGVNIDGWTKTIGTAQSSNIGVDSWSKE